MPAIISGTIIATPNLKKIKRYLMKRSGNVFPSDMTRGQYISLQRLWTVKVTFFTIWFFINNF